MKLELFRPPVSRACLMLLGLTCLPAASQSQESAQGHPGACQVEPIVTKNDGVRPFYVNGLSHDGHMIAIGWDQESGEKGTYLLNLATGERIDVPEMNNGAMFSPDGRRLLNAIHVENGKTDIVELDLESRELTVIASHPNWDWLPCYSPDGSRIAFNSYRTGNSDIYLYDRASQELTQLTDTDRYEAHAQFSPDGSKIAFHRQETKTDFNIYLIDLESGDETQVTSSPHEEAYPSWAPDGKYILFSSDQYAEPGKPDIIVMTEDGTIVSRLTHHPAKDAYAFVSPDAEYVYFNSYRKPEGVYRVKIDSSFQCESTP